MRALRLGASPWLNPGSGRVRSYPSLTGRHEAEVAVVGGGVTGASVAALFAAAGVHVAVVEGALVGRGSTAASTGLLLREPDEWLGDLSARYGARSARRIWTVAATAERDLIATLRRHAIPCGLEDADSVYYTLDPETVGPLRAEYDRRHAAGLAGRWLTPGPLRALTAIAGQGAIRTRNAQVDPYRACVGLLRAAVRAGADVYERSPVRRIEQERGGVRLVTPRGSLRADRVVIATGYATSGVVPTVGRFQLDHTFVLATHPIDARQRRELGLGRVMLWDTARPYHYARWGPGRRLFLGGGDRPLGTGRARRAAFREGAREVRDYFERLLPALLEVGVDWAWEGVFARPPDGLPYIGPHRRHPRHLFALGYGGNGTTFGFLAARLLLERWRGEVTPDHALFGFGRHR